MIFKNAITPLFILSILILSACGRQSTDRLTEVEDFTPPLSMEDLQVSDGFNFANTQEVSFDLRFEDDNGKGIDGLIIAIGNCEQGGEFSHIYTNLTNEEGRIEIILDVPLHFKKLAVRCSYAGEIRQFELRKRAEVKKAIRLEPPL